MNVPALVFCGVSWVAIGLWWVLSARGKAIAALLAHRVSRKAAPLVGPLALFLAMAVAVAGAVVLVRAPFLVGGHITPVGWIVACVTGLGFVSLQVLGAMVVMAKLQVRPSLETTAAALASKAQEHEISESRDLP